MLRKCEDLMGMPVEIEWALDDAGFKLLQARPLHVCRRSRCRTRSGCSIRKLNGHPAGVGWGSGRAVVINCECELTRVAPGDVLVTRVAGPALSHILPQVAGVVTELGGWTSHFASLARERGIPDGARRARRDRRPFPTARRSRSTASPASCGGSHDAHAASPHLRDAADRGQRACAPAQGRDRRGQQQLQQADRADGADRGRQDAAIFCSRCCTTRSIAE